MRRFRNKMLSLVMTFVMALSFSVPVIPARAEETMPQTDSQSQSETMPQTDSQSQSETTPQTDSQSENGNDTDAPVVVDGDDDIEQEALPVIVDDEPLDLQGVNLLVEDDGILVDDEEVEILTASSIENIDDSLAKMDNSYEKIIFAPSKNGIYFVSTVGTVYSNSSNQKISFYDLNTKQITDCYSRSYIDCFYADDNAIYFLDGVSSSCNPAITWNGTAYNRKYVATVYKYDIATDTVSSVVLAPIYSNTNWAGFFKCFGVDDSGRYYISTTEGTLFLFSATGGELSYTSNTGSIYEFYDFDSINGNFYYRGYYNWVYWGYDHLMSSLMAGNVTDNQISVASKNLSILYQNGFFIHYDPVEMVNEKYLAILSTFASDRLMLIDSNVYNISDYTEQKTNISMADGSVSVSALNIANADARKLEVQSAESEYESNVDVSSYGSRCAMKQDGTGVIVKTDANVLTEFSIAERKAIVKANTTYPVYDFHMMGNKLIAVENNNGDFYLETFEWTIPTDYQVSIPSTMNVGDSATLSCTTDETLKLSYTYSSSNPSVVSVSQDGQLLAWKTGTSVISITTSPNNIPKSYTITVNAGSSGSGVYTAKTSTGNASNIIHKPVNYGRYGNIITAYIKQLSSGNYNRVEYVDSKVLVEEYNQNYELQSTKTIDMELPLFGGYYNDGTNNYLVFGQSNTDASDEVEVIRVVKYDASWNKLASCSVYGANTKYPFEAGGLDMDFVNGKLYIHTCHLMYDGHQANCTFVINVSDMTIADSFYDVMNISSGYVSHSFMQKICADDQYIYRIDLGDAYPRGIAYTQTKLTSTVDRPSAYGTVIGIFGDTGANTTGYALGAAELSENKTLITGNGLKDENATTKNIWLCYVDKTTGECKTNWITEHVSDAISVGVPKLVKLNKNQFLLMWEEENINDYPYEYTTKMVLVTPTAECVSKIYSSKLPLSMCDPIVNAKGNVCWYVTGDDGSTTSAPTFFEINPFNLDNVENETIHWTNGGSTGGSTGGNTGGSTGGNTGGSTGGSTGGNTGGSAGNNNNTSVGRNAMHRLYNPNSGEHFYTANYEEAMQVQAAGWTYEGIGWYAPSYSNTPVYRLYNQYGGEHHYTSSATERDSLVSVGWTYEGIGWYSDDNKAVPIYRQYNPNAFSNNHNYSPSKAENDMLISIGWKYEGISWYGVN